MPDRIYTNRPLITMLFTERDLDFPRAAINTFTPSGTANQLDLGGTEGMLFQQFGVAGVTARIDEIDPDTGVTLNTSFPTVDSLHGCGGIQTRLYRGDNPTGDVAEFDRETLLQIGSFVFSGEIALVGVGGTSTRLFQSNEVNSGTFLELDPDTKLEINRFSHMESGSEGGIGGVSTRLYFVQRTGQQMFEVDPDTLLFIGATSSTLPGGSAKGCGGTKEASTDGDGISNRDFYYLLS